MTGPNTGPMTGKSAFSTLTRGAQPLSADLKAWFADPLGDHVINTESAMLEQLLPSMFGYHLMQCSVQDRPLFDSSPIQHKFPLNLDNSVTDGMLAKPASLPLANDSIDVSLIHHLLDYVENPLETLREMARVTLPMGHIVIVGFNPLSTWGIWQQIARYKGNAPWTGRFIRPGRVMDWLNLLNFKIDRAQYAIYRPPLSRYPGKLGDYSQGVSRNLNLPIGSVYVIVAKKHIGAVLPIKPVWSTSKTFGRLSVVRSIKHDGLTSIEHETGQE